MLAALTLSPELQVQVINLLIYAGVAVASVVVFYLAHSKLVDKYGAERVAAWSKSGASAIDKLQQIVPSLRVGGVAIAFDTLEAILNGFDTIKSDDASGSNRHQMAKEFIKSEVKRLGGNQDELSDEQLDFMVKGLVKLFRLDGKNTNPQ